MADEMGDIFAEQLGGEVVPNANSAQEAMVVDLSTPETPTESTEATTTETPTKNESSETSTTEAPVVETPVETQDNNSDNRSLNNESNDQPREKVSSADAVKESKKQFLKFINDQFKTNFDSINSFNEALTNTKKPSFANEQIEKMNKFVSETGRGIADYIRTQAVDYSKMSNEDVMRVSLKQNNPDLTMDEVNTLIAAKYRTDKDKYSESDQTLGKIAMKKDVSKARKELMNMQEKYRMPVQKDSSAEDTANREEWVKNMSSEVGDVESITFDINDSGEQFTFSLTDDHRKGLVDANSNLNGFFDQYVGENGNWNFDKLNTDMFVLNNFQDILRSVANQYKSKGTEQVVKDIKNPSFNNEPRQTSGNKKSVIQELDDIINGDNEGLRIG